VLTYVSAGHLPPLVLRRDGSCERLSDGGIALGMFEGSVYTPGHVTIQPGELLAVYSDGISEAENPQGVPFDEAGLESALRAHRREGCPRSARRSCASSSSTRRTGASRTISRFFCCGGPRCPV
jgi:serine phosphatase RsbU (regulator of sigma subunit)